MKKLILSLIFLFSFSLAISGQKDEIITEIVEARGYGATQEAQLRNAKLSALGKVVGEFIVGQITYQSNKDEVFQNIKEYKGGYIETYEILKLGTEYVDIKATIRVIKDNRIYIQGDNEIDIEDQMNNYRSKRDVINYLDDPKEAFHISVKGIQIDPQPYKVRFKISNVLKWQPKWVSDLETFVIASTDIGKTSNQVNIRMVSQRGFDPTVGIVQSLFESKPKQSDDPMVCFASKSNSNVDGCRNLAGGFQNMPIHSELPIIIIAYDKDDNEIFKRRVLVDGNKLYENVYRNQTKKYFLTKRTFDQPAFIVYKNGIQQFDITADIDTEIAEQIKTFKLEASI